MTRSRAARRSCRGLLILWLEVRILPREQPSPEGSLTTARPRTIVLSCSSVSLAGPNSRPWSLLEAFGSTSAVGSDASTAFRTVGSPGRGSASIGLSARGRATLAASSSSCARSSTEGCATSTDAASASSAHRSGRTTRRSPRLGSAPRRSYTNTDDDEGTRRPIDTRRSGAGASKPS